MLNVDYFNPAQKTLTILGKGNKFRLIKLDQKTTDLIKLYITQYRSHPNPIYQHCLFINKHGAPLTRKGIYLLCQKYLSIALNPKWLKMIHPVHSFRLRHEYAGIHCNLLLPLLILISTPFSIFCINFNSISARLDARTLIPDLIRDRYDGCKQEQH